MAKANRKGRSKGVRHLRMDHSLFYSRVVKSLSTTARSLLWELIGLYNGSNNGELFLSVREAQKLLGLGSDAPITKAFRDLQDHGLIAVMTKGAFSQKIAHASVWRLTFEHMPGMAPTRDYERWQPIPGSEDEKRLNRYSRSNLRSCNYAVSAAISRTVLATPRTVNLQSAPPAGTAKMQNLTNPEYDNVVQIRAQLSYHTSVAGAVSLEACRLLRRKIYLWLDEVPSRTQRQIAREAGISESRLSRFLTGASRRKTLLGAEWNRIFDVLRKTPRSQSAL